MSTKQRYRGLRFKYICQVDGREKLAKFDTLEEFLATEFPKNGNPMSPDYNTAIYSISWNGKAVTINNCVKTLRDLKAILLNNPYVSTRDIRIAEYEKFQPARIRKSVHSIEEIYNLTKDVLFEKRKQDAKVNLDGDIIKGNSQRYQLFFTKGLRCSHCGIEGRFFAKEKRSEVEQSYHLNLYAIDENGKEVLMTKDHIIPKSLGGKDDLSNYQTMCERCNANKRNKMIY